MARESLPPPAPGLQPGQRLAVIDADGRVVEVVSTAPAQSQTPTADVVRIKAFRHTRELRVYCPYCAEEHWHGLGWETRDREQFRLAHCGKGSYRIVVPSRAAELVRPGRRTWS
jgi:hypothetical protein